ncbi:hypothetical protein S83_059928, partial [Arachis hypogaea]
CLLFCRFMKGKMARLIFSQKVITITAMTGYSMPKVSFGCKDITLWVEASGMTFNLATLVLDLKHFSASSIMVNPSLH